MSLSEIFRVALMDTVLGMGTVFCVLIFISLIISCFGPVSKALEGFFNKEKPEEIHSQETVVQETVVPMQEEELTDDLELVAVITAAIAAFDEVESDDFIVRSIKRSRKNSWK